MAWMTTADVAAFFASAGGLLRSAPAENTILLTTAAAVRDRGPGAFGDTAPLFGWWHEDGQPAAAFVHTPPYPAVITALTRTAGADLAGEFAGRGRRLCGVNGDPGSAAVFAAAWREHTGQSAEVTLRTRLYRLAQLRAPDSPPKGRARLATTGDRALVISWLEAFGREADPGAPGEAELVADDRLSFHGVTLWEAGGEPVALASLHRAVAGQVRVGPVYTPVHRRRQGFGGAVTAAACRAALAAGARDVVLFTDLANPTSNMLYQRLGFRAISDRVVLAFR